MSTDHPGPVIDAFLVQAAHRVFVAAITNQRHHRLDGAAPIYTGAIA